MIKVDIDQLKLKLIHAKDKHDLKVFIIKYMLKHNLQDVQDIIDSLKYKGEN
nr:MAG TPA: hypothetical protein [Caudoviricetes sp.]